MADLSLFVSEDIGTSDSPNAAVDPISAIAFEAVSVLDSVSTDIGIPTTLSTSDPVTVSDSGTVRLQSFTNVSVKIELELNGRDNGWTDVTEDVRRDAPIIGQRGIRGQLPTDRVASTGSLTFSLDNSENNSAGLVGYYTPGHANVRSGFQRGIGVRASIVIEGTAYPQFVGQLSAIRPAPGAKLSRVVDVEALDYMDQLSRKRLTGLAPLQGVSDDTVFSTIIGAMQVQPRALEVQSGFDTIQFAFDNLKDERAAPISELQRLAQSTLAFIYVKGDGTLVYENRRQRGFTNTSNVLEITEADLPIFGGLGVRDDQGDTVNRVQTIIHPRRTDASPVTLYRLQNPTELEPNTTVNIRGLYTDPSARASRVGGFNMITPVAGTDYVLNTKSDGTGTDVTAKATVTASFGANSVLFTISHNHSSNAFITTLQARGQGIYDQEPVTLEDEDTSNIAVNGEFALSMNMPLQGDALFGLEVAQWLRHLSTQQPKQLDAITVILNGLTVDRAVLFVLREISDRIGVTESVTAIPTSSNSGFHINAVGFSQSPDGTVTLSFLPVAADGTSFWHLEVVGQSELDQTTRLGFGLVIGHTDVAHSDSHDDSPHQDSPHSDFTDSSHGDSAHGDSTHTDSHSDSAHSDTAHSDSHSDVAHSDTPHTDSHSDQAHVDSHSDVAHSDSHSDTAHSDSHSDHTDSDSPHDDSHSDTAHSDSHSDGAHSDSHSDTAHSDSHNDVSHSDVAHTDSHSDVAHSDVNHSDSHGDAAHTDQAHVDTHTDNPHQDVDHADSPHGDSHSDVSHGDIT